MNSSKDELDFLGDPEVEDAFSGDHEDLENAAEQLYSSPPCSQPLHFETLSLKMPKTVPPSPDTVLQNRIENKLEKNLGSQLNMETDFHGPALPPQFGQKVKSEFGSDPIVRLNQRNTRIRENIKLGANMLLLHLLQRNLRPLCKSKSLLSPKLDLSEQETANR